MEAAERSEAESGTSPGVVRPRVGEATLFALGQVAAPERTLHLADRVEQARIFEALFRQAAEPTILGRYVVLDTLGEGGMGVVLRAFDRELDRPVALKVLHGHLDECHTARLRREAQAMAKLSHPNVVQVYEVGEVDERTFVAMELVKGKTLTQWMQQEPRPDWRACVELFIQLGEGLAAAHEQGLVHRDFKPGNAILDDKGRARVLDFGLARRGEDGQSGGEDVGGAARIDPQVVPLEVSLTKTGAVLGTPAYMPLEQMQGHEADARSDQFSFCVSLYEAIHGERPYEGSSLAALMVAMQDGMVRPVPRGSKVPVSLRKLLLRGLSIEPEQRWPSMEALLEELRRLVAPRGWRRVAGVGVVLATVAGVLAVWQGGVISEQGEQLTEKEALLAQRVEELEERDRRVATELATQKGLRASMLARIPSHEIEALGLAVEALGEIDTASPRRVPAAVFTGLTSSLMSVQAGLSLEGHSDKVDAVAFSPDGSRVATASWDHTLRLWDARSGDALVTLEGHRDRVDAVAFSPDGSRIVTASWDHTLRLWNVDSGEPIGDPLTGHAGPVYSVAVSPDGARIASVGGDDTLRIWSAATGDALSSTAVDGRIWALAFSPRGDGLATAGDDGAARIWDPSGEQSAVFMHERPVVDVAFSPDGSRLATASKGEPSARIWELSTAEVVLSLPHGDLVWAVAFSPDGSQVATAGWEDDTARLWDVPTGRLVGSFPHEGAVVDVVFSPDGKQLATASWDRHARLWNLRSSRALMTLEGHRDRVETVDVSPDGALIVTGSRDNSARVWDARSGRPRMTLRGHGLDLTDVAFSPDGSSVATASWDGTARLWDVGSGETRAILEGHEGRVHAVAFSPDGARLTSAGQDGTVRSWDVATGGLRYSISLGVPVVDVRLSPDGAHVVTLGADERIRRWEASSGREVASLVPAERATAMALSVDGALLAVAGKDHVIRTWDTSSGVLVHEFAGHTAPITKVVFSSDGSRLSSASKDDTTRLWSTETEAEIVALVHADAVADVSFSPDGSGMVTVGGDDVARLWDLDYRAWLEWGCAVLDERETHSDDSRTLCAASHDAASHVVPPAGVLTHEREVWGPAATPEHETIVVHGVELVLIDGGTFVMGAPIDEVNREDNEGPQHELELASFYLARTEVTNAQYAIYLEANPDAPKPAFWDNERNNQPEQPVVGISWYEAKAYCDWAGLVLPTEAQWEYAARGGAGTAYWFGDEIGLLERFGWFSKNSGRRSHFVAKKDANAFGLYDVHGNVYEWALDGSGSYDIVPRAGDGLRHGPRGGEDRILRSGGWGDVLGSLRSANRYDYAPIRRSPTVGFRPARLGSARLGSARLGNDEATRVTLPLDPS